MNTHTQHSAQFSATAGALVGGGLVIGFTLPRRCVDCAATGPGDGDFRPNSFLRIRADDTITVMVGLSEMGQGVLTSIPS